MHAREAASVALQSLSFLILSCFFSSLLPAADPVEAEIKIEWGPDVNGVQASLSADKKSYLIGEPILLTYRVKNRSQNIVDITYDRYQSYCLKMDIVHFRDKNTPKWNTLIPLTKYGQGKFGNYISSFSGTDIHPNHMLTWYFNKIPINRLYDMSLPGEYHISLKRNLGNVTVTSNLLKINIKEPPKPDYEQVGRVIEKIDPSE
ncbi:hypothetical protein [Gimesia sp.]|uniref:hypothetical protein n=1 Tax=Gimesia sp. TaxID=2024833 RepID=UPI000C6888E7|nr:hypothetical protein [Gimesia sp.]MAX39798.1 hypothetical protein [Gimesia sp.]HBL48264.1 hypothetical protein [Planctomycetaceae bacterium]|tara:strand:+ start:102 stop:713 length:612 start_codon:yes stop_codon:yes gene_type:complete